MGGMPTKNLKSMALTIVFQNGQNVNWHVGQPNPMELYAAISVAAVCADGHELEKIKAEIGGIPTAKKRVVMYYGDDAKFIAANLDY